MSTQKPQSNPEESKDQLSEADLGSISGGTIGIQQGAAASAESLSTQDALARLQQSTEKSSQTQSQLNEIKKSLLSGFPGR